MASASDWTSGKRKVGTLLLLVAFALAAGLTSCGDGSGPTETEDDPREDVVTAYPGTTISNAVGALAGTGSLAAASQSATYVSASPGTFPRAQEMTITNEANGQSQTVSVVAGGFDPVAIEAAPGDTLDFLVSDTDGSTSEYFTLVPPRKRPRVVRTVPPKGATDVVLSVTVVVVFSEPIDANTSTTETVQLLLDGAPVDGTLELSGDGLRASFTPAAPLQQATVYTLVVTTGLLDLQGDALEEELLATFTTANGLEAGADHTCTVRADGAAVCWGSNWAGQLGRPSSGWGLPGLVPTELNFESLNLGAWYTCGVTPDLQGYCWGYNDVGQLGDGTTANYRENPAAVSGGHGFVSLAASTGGHTCGLKATGAAYCWGNNDSGQLGDGSTTNRDTPVLVPVGRAFVSLTVGYFHTCGLTTGGAAFCWGGNWNGQLGAQSFETCDGWDCSTVPMLVSGGQEFVSLAAGAAHTCGITADESAYCWGANEAGELGIGIISDVSEAFYTPEVVEGGHTYVSIVAAYSYTCGLTSGGQAYCWGVNNRLQLGIGTNTGLVPTPTAVVGGHVFATITAGWNHACALTSGGDMYCWGANGDGQLGHDPSSQGRTSIPIYVPLP
ncbi:MAG: Ig-like domain-containing protein [Gemmatimonadales bacterium]|jgi:alpha-tubulin suppressor-like RCC1 family protein